jgi:hypothetical protein
LRDIQRALECVERLLAIAFGTQDLLSTSYEKVGNVLVAQGKLEDALETYQQGLGIAKRLTPWMQSLKILQTLVEQKRVQRSLVRS